MKKLEAIIRPHLLEKVQDALERLGVQGMTVSDVKGFGRCKDQIDLSRAGRHPQEPTAKVKIEIILEDEILEQAIDMVFKAARTGKDGDGKIFVLPMDDRAGISMTNLA